LDGNLGAFFGFGGDAGLGEGDFEACGVVVRDKRCLAQAIDESFATASEVVGVEEAAGTALNAETSALAACFLSFR
jgi:hypothetical protein